MNTNDKFWLVWNPQQGKPVVKHPTQGEALDEAKRIAALEQVAVYVCECVGYYAPPQVSPVVWTGFGRESQR